MATGKPGKVPLVIARAKKPVDEMTEAEIDGFAKAIVDAMRANLEAVRAAKAAKPEG